MFLLSLALFAQTATLDADPHEAALTCGAAAAYDPALNDLERLAVGIHFSLLAGRANPAAIPLIDKFTIEAPAVRKRTTELGPKAAAFLPECRARFPMAWSSAPITLPTAEFPRKMLCTTAVGLYMGAFGTTKGSVEDVAYFDRLAKRFRPMVTAADLARNGVTTHPQLLSAMSDALNPSLDKGNVLGVTRACDAAFPS